MAEAVGSLLCFSTSQESIVILIAKKINDKKKVIPR